jgi:hypothetical protein
MAPSGRYTRANTAPGSPERKQVYAREFAARKAREGTRGLTYHKARQLRSLYKLSPTVTNRIVHRDGRAKLTEEHTRYAILRAHVARAQQRAGERITPTQAAAVRQIAGLPNLPNATVAMGSFYTGLGLSPGSLPHGRAPQQETEGGGGGGGGDVGADNEDYGDRGADEGYYGEGEEDTGGPAADFQRSMEDMGIPDSWQLDDYDDMDYEYDIEQFDEGEYPG